MNPCVVFDIETAPDDRIWGDPEFVGKLRRGLRAPANLRDPVKIAGAIADKFDKLRDGASLNHCLGRIRAIGWCSLDVADEPQAVASEDEAEVIGTFVDRALREFALVGGFNVRDFDIPFLSVRAAVHGIALPNWWPGPRSWDRIIDPCDVFGREHHRLADYLLAFGLPGKTADGADAPGMPLDELLAYVSNDVFVERLLIQRIATRFPALFRAA